MKYVAILLIFLGSLRNVNAQDTTSRSPIPMIALSAVSVVSGAIGDGLNSRAKYGPGHALCAVSYVSLIALPFVSKPNWKFPVTYLLIRYALFDAMYNVGANRNLNYIGGTNYYDESVGKMPASVLHGTKFISIGAVIFINTKIKHHEKVISNPAVTSDGM